MVALPLVVLAVAVLVRAAVPLITAPLPTVSWPSPTMLVLLTPPRPTELVMEMPASAVSLTEVAEAKLVAMAEPVTEALLPTETVPLLPMPKPVRFVALESTVAAPAVLTAVAPRLRVEEPEMVPASPTVSLSRLSP